MEEGAGGWGGGGNKFYLDLKGDRVQKVSDPRFCSSAPLPIDNYQSLTNTNYTSAHIGLPLLAGNITTTQLEKKSWNINKKIIPNEIDSNNINLHGQSENFALGTQRHLYSTCLQFLAFVSGKRRF